MNIKTEFIKASFVEGVMTY